jgi:hypothetical protein
VELTTQNDDSRSWQRSTAKRYRDALDSESGEAARAYLATRGLSPETIAHFGIGVVDDPDPIDKSQAGWLAIPYVARCPVKGPTVQCIRFRTVGDPKRYHSRLGDKPRLYNVSALLADTDEIHIAEGEMDTMSLWQAGFPAIGVPGASAWGGVMPRLVRGYARVYVWADDDSAGRKLAERIRTGKAVDPENKEEKERRTGKACEPTANVRILTPPDGDVNATLIERGEEYLKEMIDASR